MLQNYLKIAWRSLLKNRRLTIINLVGLSLSIAFCLLLFFYIRYEQSYDSFHKKKDRIFRMEMSRVTSTPAVKPQEGLLSFLHNNEDEVSNQLVFPLVVGLDVKSTFPEVRSVTRFAGQGSQLVKANNETFRQDNILYADDNFFNNFSFPVITGNLGSALKSREKVVISESTAKKFFGSIDVIGKSIELVTDSGVIHTVSAVVADAPSNSSIKYDIIIPLLADEDYDENIRERFNHSSHLLVIELADNVSPVQFEAKLNKWVRGYYVEPYIAEYGEYLKNADFSKFRWYMRGLADCHYNASYPWGHYTNSKNIYQLACLVIVILLIASLNYILLVISNAAARSQEVGVRKVMGAKRISIVLQFWLETQLVVMVALILGLVLTVLLLPAFNNMVDSNLRLSELSWMKIVPQLLLFCIILGLGAGYYPALIISNMKTLSVIKSFQTLKINPVLSKVMVVLQYTGCVVLMLAAFVIHQQMKYISNKDLGFDKEQVLMVKNPTYDRKFTTRTRERLRQFASSQSYIMKFSGMNGGLDGSYNNNGFKLNGEQKWRKQLTVDYDYFEMLGIEFIEGRPFSRSIPSDTSTKFRPLVINESLYKLLGKEATLGQYCEPIHGTIIGITKDYHFETLTKKIEPEEHVLAVNYEMYFMFKIKAGQTPHAIAGIGREWKKITDYPFEYMFLHETITKMYEADLRWQKTIQASCFFAIFIACMGLFGLSAINAINRTKEVGIRKVLGADVKDIVATLSSSFLVMTLIAILIATPIAWWIMNRWLEDFAYRITISWWMFVAVGAVALLIALATVSLQAIKAAVVNPVKSLRAE